MAGKEQQGHQSAHLPRLSLSDPHELDQVRRVIGQLDTMRAEFCAWLQSVPKRNLSRRPAARKWSALEHVRHLVTAEETYSTASAGA